MVVPDRAAFTRAGAAIVATLLVSLLFTASYAGALHAPTPHQVPVAVSAQVPPEVVSGLDRGDALKVVRVADPAAAQRLIQQRDTYGSIIVNPAGRLRVTVAPAASPTVAQLLSVQVVDQLKRAGVNPTTSTVFALPASDTRGTVAFYLGIGCVLAGYFGATLLGLALGTKVRAGRVTWRLVALAVLAALMGLAATAIATAIGGYDRGFLTISAICALTVLAVGTVTMAFQSVLGLAGTGLAILLFVILGNPAAGGAAPPELLPGLWRATGQVLPNGAAVTGIRDAAYFPDAPVSGPLLVLGVWFVVAAAAVAVIGRRGRGLDGGEAEASVAAAAA